MCVPHCIYYYLSCGGILWISGLFRNRCLHCLRLMDVLMLIWLTLRTLKYEVVTDLTVARYLWYLYYLPILFIPRLVHILQFFWENPKIISFPEKAGCYR